MRATAAASTLHGSSGEIACTFSVGLDERCDADTLATLKARADAALYLTQGDGSQSHGDGRL
ncbi:unnamed protein product (plasmid) [Mycetohabitans rhizoxinica HKI 454]|uniref:GGDEF domain-containing protein n=1 Tax=Mycetohabitans rhizoxinica (strain DSM 19002 / CIP 109453 / HKI 454) TaxID=882378 RepID=E5AVF0_MYCRK|nr:unnamed protein product [Mycetohabitans rhizoxinica HKI 454]